MQVVRGDDRIQDPVCLLIGNYDGIHRGHQTLITRAKALAEARGLKTAVLSFEPHPLKVLRPERAPRLLHTPQQKCHLLDYYGVDYYLIQTFDVAFSQLSPQAFIDTLRERVRFEIVIVGFNFFFGHQRAGDVNTLRAMGAAQGFEVQIADSFNLGDAAVSSSRIRKLVTDGDVAAAGELLGRPYFLEGDVVHGRQLGRTIDAPTANVRVANELLPRFGVYASWVRLADGRWFRSITNLGSAPTVNDDGQPLVETQLFEFSEDLYGAHIMVCLKDFIRPEQRFESVDVLKAQIKQDVLARKAMPDVDAPDFEIGFY